ncbi:MAG: beta-propeller fold lactonase family protein [Bryobacteraceae bacterium]
MRLGIPLLLACMAAGVAGAATFGTAVPVAGGLADLVLDENRSRLYLVNTTQNRIEIYSTAQRKLLDPIPTGPQPLACALSRGGKYLYVTVYGAAALEIIDLDAASVLTRVSLPAAPEGVAVGADEGVLITTVGTAGSGSDNNRLLRFDPATGALLQIPSTLLAPASPATPSPGQVYNASRSHLLATPDGRLIIGLNNPNTSSRSVFVYETASATVLRSRTVSNISSVLSVAPDGSRFMAGLSMFETETLAILAQQNAANSLYPFANNVNFNTQANQGGSVFAPDGSVLYSAFNIAPVQTAGTANSSQLMLSDPENMLIRMGLQLPENLTGKMVISSNGAAIYALSQSGLLSLPVFAIYDSPIAQVESPAVLLAGDQCGAAADLRTAQVTVRNAGRGRMSVMAQVNQTGVTFTAPLGGDPGRGAGAGGPGQGIPIVLPGGGNPVLIPPAAPTGGTASTTQQRAIVQNAPQVTARPSGSDTILQFTYNTRTSTSLGTPAPVDFLVSSPEAINIPFRVRVYQNSRNAEAEGSVTPVPVSVSTAEGLVDIVSDTLRQKLYIANSGMNRVEVFDTNTNQFLAPVKVGQLPRSLALSPDGNFLYVANTGGESISVIDLEKQEVTGKVRFPPLPYNASVALNTPSVIAAGLAGLQIVMSDGTLWRVVDNVATPRRTSTVIGSSTIQSPRTMIAAPGGEYIVLLGGNGVGYLYDAMADEYVLSQQVASTPIQGYYGPLAAGPRGQYFVVNGSVLNQSLVPVPGGAAGASRPVSAVAALNATTFARFVQPVRANTSSSVTQTPTVELVDAASGMTRGSATALEGPLSTQVGTQRVNVPARTMALDASGSTAYLLTTSGLSIVPLPQRSQQGRPQVNSNGIVNTANYQSSMAPGSIVSIFGQNLASQASASAPLPSVLGGACVTIDNTAAPMLLASPSQINVQLPPDLTAAKHTVVVRSIDKHMAAAAQTVTVSKYAPAVFVDAQTGQAAIYHADGRFVTKSAPARRDEALYIYATGLGVTTGGKVTAGAAAPSDPPAVTQPVKVFFGDPAYKQSEMIVEWSGLVPGVVGIYRIDVRVPGSHMQGDALPVTVRIGGVDSPKAAVAVD